MSIRKNIEDIEGLHDTNDIVYTDKCREYFSNLVNYIEAPNIKGSHHIHLRDRK